MTDILDKIKTDRQHLQDMVYDTAPKAQRWNAESGLKVLDAVISEIETLRADIACLKPEWKNIDTAPKGKTINAAFKNQLGNWRIVTCFHALPFTLEMSEDCDFPEGGDWHEESGQHYCVEGWYECGHSFEYAVPLDGIPTHWSERPSPPLYSGQT